MAEPANLRAIQRKMDEIALRARNVPTNMGELPRKVDILRNVTDNLRKSIIQISARVKNIKIPEVQDLSAHMRNLDSQIATLQRLLGEEPSSDEGTGGEEETKAEPGSGPAPGPTVLPGVPAVLPEADGQPPQQGGGSNSTHPASESFSMQGGYKWNRSASKSKSKTRKGKKGKKGKKSKKSKKSKTTKRR